MAKTKSSGGGRIKSQGKSLVWVTFDAKEKQKIRVASATIGKPMSQFLKECGLAAADKILKNPTKLAE